MTDIKHRLLEAADQSPGWRKLCYDTCSQISSLEHQLDVSADRIAAQDKRIADLEQLNQTLLNVRGVLWLDVEIRDKRIAELKAQLAAQAGQEPCIEVVVDRNGGAIVHLHELEIGTHYLYAAPPAPASALAIVYACADECERTTMSPGGRREFFARHGVVNAATALRDNAQAIIDAARGK